MSIKGMSIKGMSILGFLLAGILSVSSGFARTPGPGPAPALAHNWSVNLGAAYPFIDGRSTEGNVETADAEGDAHVKDSNLEYSSEWASEVGLFRHINRYVQMGLSYQYLKTSIDTKKEIQSVGGEAIGTSYSGELTINALLLKTNFKWWHAFSIMHVPTSPYVGVGLGISYLKLTQQRTVINNGTAGSLVPNRTWNFAYSAELGLSSELSSLWHINYGVRYASYGAYKSGKKRSDYTQGIKKAVKARVYSYMPFVNLSYQFG